MKNIKRKKRHLKMSNNMTVNIALESHKEEILQASAEQIIRALTAIGLTAEGYAKLLCPVGKENGGNLRNSITNYVDPEEKSVIIGTNVHYAPYVEFGTGFYSTLGGGTPKTHWVYFGEDGNWHIGHPMPARPFLKPAFADHLSEWNAAIEKYLKD